MNNSLSDSTPIVGKLSIISMKGCEEITAKINDYLKRFRDYENAETYVAHVTCPRFGTGEAKCVIDETVRGHDVYIICDCFNYGVTYKMYGVENRMSPDDHFQDLKRVIAAMGGKARRVTVVMPMLYEGRQHRRAGRESLDAALMLQELVNMGVSNIITFDAHDPRISNAIPLSGFDDVQPTYQMIKALVRSVPDIRLDKTNTIVISPDEGGMSRCMYYSSVLKLDLGMFYKRRDYSTIVNGKNPIVAHEFLGDDVHGKTVIIIDDMISSGESMLDVTRQLKDRGAERVFVCTTFGLFTEGLDKFDEYYEKGYLDRLITTNLTYLPPQLHDKPYFIEADMSKFLALIIDSMNHSTSISAVMNPTDKIHDLLAKRNMR